MFNGTLAYTNAGVPGDVAGLLILAAMIGAGHTATGPDHYLPFIAMSRVGKWSYRKTVAIGTLCGVGHVFGSVVIGLLGVAFGWAVGGLQWFESQRGAMAGWLLFAFGLAYMVWGLHRAWKNKTHTHVHIHADGTIHSHVHTHHNDHAHIHTNENDDPAEDVKAMTPWILFTIFVFGPCEPLIPLLIYPAAEHNWYATFLVTIVFSICTIGTMVLVITLGYYGLAVVGSPKLERYMHALAGFALAACGLAIEFGM